MKKLFFYTLSFISFTCLFAVKLQAQYYSTGQDPASIRWKQIKTGNFRIIYLDDFENRAQYLANILDLIKIPETNSLKSKVGRMPVVIHNRSSVSNGYTI